MCPLSSKFHFYFKKGSSKKFPMSVAPMSRKTKRAILGYYPKNDEKRNLVHKGLKNENFPFTLTLQRPGGNMCPLSSKFRFYFKKGSSKKFPMSVAPMSRKTKRAILGYYPNNDEKRNLVHKGLKK